MPELTSKYGASGRIVGLSACVVALLLLLHFYRPPQGGLWMRHFFDALHVPVFGMIAVCTYFAFEKTRSEFRRVGWALIVSIGLGATSEVLQIPTSRDASFGDLLADTLGAAGFLCALLALIPNAAVPGRRRLLLAVAATGLLAWSLLPLATISIAYLERNAQVPELVSFADRHGRLFTRIQHIDYELVAARPSQRAHAKVTLGSGPWPGVAFHDLWPDWSGYSDLVIDLSVDGDSSLQLHIRVHDALHRAYGQTFTDRFNRSFSLEPGDHTLTIPMTDILIAPRDRKMNLEAVSEIILFGSPEDAGRTFKIYSIRLQ